MHNICLMSDSYKFGHWKDYPAGTRTVYSYLESRGTTMENQVIGATKTVFSGLQYYILKYLVGSVVTREGIDEAQEVIDAHLGPGVFNRAGWEYIIEKHNGHLPVEIWAVPEGAQVDMSNVLVTIENTDPMCFWLTNFLETLLLKVWYPTTVATLSYNIKQRILQSLEKTGDPSGIDFKLIDFGYRGVSSEESAAIGGAAHLINFQGGETLAAIKMLREYYDCPMGAFSIPATEHSIICSFGQDGEKAAYENFLNNHPEGIISCVSDTYDIMNAVNQIWGTELKPQVMARKGTLVVRPDSGDPTTIVLKVLDALGNRFGYELNGKGYKVLDPHVRVIQGDGINYQSISLILGAMQHKGWSADNITFGMGGALLQQMNRDTFKFAFKASFMELSDANGKIIGRDIYKNPTTDLGKASKAGRLELNYSNGTFKTNRKDDKRINIQKNYLVPVFRNGKILKRYTFTEIRNQTEILSLNNQEQNATNTSS